MFDRVLSKSVRRKEAEINSFFPNAPFLYPLIISENLRFSDVFREVEKGCNGNKWVKKNCNSTQILTYALCVTVHLEKYPKILNKYPLQVC